MALTSVFEQASTDDNLARLEKLKIDTQPLWGKMNSAQMLAHVNVGFDIATDALDPKPSGFAKFMIKLFGIKKMVCEENPPYKKNSRTAPIFLISDEREFDKEKAKLIASIYEVVSRGEKHYEGKHNPSFGTLSAKEWSVQMQKHLHHHLNQFGV